MTNLQNYLGTPKLDSLKLSTNISYEPKKVKKSLVRHDTGEIEKDLEVLDSYTNEINGITFGCGYQYVPSIRQYQKYYLVNSKQLEAQYFNGINKDNISYTYENIMSNIPTEFRVKKDQFLNGSVSDLDICLDILLDNVYNSQIYYKHLYECFETKYDSNNIKLYRDNDIVNAFAIANRSTANNKIPYYKAYHKGHELNTKSLEFNRSYLSHICSDQLNIINRSEITYKYGKEISNILKSNKLNMILNSDIETIFNKKMSKHFGGRFNFSIDQTLLNKKLNAFEMSLLNFILSDKNKIERSEFLDRTVLRAHIKYECRKAKNRQIKRNNELFDIYESLRNNSLLFE